MTSKTLNKVEKATWEATRDATWVATRDETWVATADATRNMLREIIQEL